MKFNIYYHPLPHLSTMAPTNDTERAKRKRTASTRVRDPANDAEPELPSHREEARHHAAAAAVISSTTTTSAQFHQCASVADANEDDNDIEVVNEESPAEGMALLFFIFFFFLKNSDAWQLRDHRNGHG